MSALLAWLNAVPKDRWIHYALSVIAFPVILHLLPLVPDAVLTPLTRELLSFPRLVSATVATLIHVAKKVRDYARGSRDWSDLIQDSLFGAAGALNALLCSI